MDPVLECFCVKVFLCQSVPVLECFCVKMSKKGVK